MTGIVAGGRPDRKALDRLRQLLALSPVFCLAACLEPGVVFGVKGVAAVLNTVCKGVGVEDPRAVCPGIGVTAASLIHLLIPDIRIVGISVVGAAVA